MFTLVKKHYKKIVIVMLALLALLSAVQGCRNAAEYSQDFQWDAAKIMLKGFNPYDESIEPSEEMLALGYEKYYLQLEANQFPSLLFELAPYTLLEPLAARYAWLVSNLIFTLIVMMLLRVTFMKEVDKEDFVILMLLMVAGTPWRNHIGVGQHTVFAFMFFLAAVYADEKLGERPFGFFASGLLLSVSYFKYTLTAPLALYFVYKKKYKELAVSVVPHLVMTVYGAHLMQDTVLNMIKKPLAVASWLSAEGSMDIGSMLGGGKMTMLLTVILMALLFVMAIMLPENNDLLFTSVLLLWSLIITYHRSYDYFVMVLPYAWLLKNRQNGKSERVLITYILLTLLVFFGLRIANESDISILITAICYYIYTLYVTFIAVRAMKRA